MEYNFTSKLKHAWNIFMSRAPTAEYSIPGNSYYSRPDRVHFSGGNEKSIATPIYNRIAIDAAATSIRHCILDSNDRFKSYMDSPLDTCLSFSANLDQTSRAFFQDVVMSLLDEGSVAIVPVDTDVDPETGAFDIFSLRVGQIIEWKPYHVKVRVYNEIVGEKQDIYISKKMVAIVENPFYALMNERNSVLQRLVRKLALLDVTDEQTASGKLDLIVQLPYQLKTETRRKDAEKRRKELEEQLVNSKYGIAYTDATEKVTQLNRSLENNIIKHVEYLTNQFFSQLGITQSILEGSADEQTMLNYYTRTIEPIIAAIVDEMNRKFLTKTARTQHKAIKYFRDPFKLVPVNNIAEIADKMTRNEVMTSNEIRQVIGMRPSEDPKADQLVNSNISQSKQAEARYLDSGDANLEEGGIEEYA